MDIPSTYSPSLVQKSFSNEFYIKMNEKERASEGSDMNWLFPKDSGKSLIKWLQRYKATLCTIDLRCAPSTCVVHHKLALCTMVHVHKGDLIFFRSRGQPLLMYTLVGHNVALYWLGGAHDNLFVMDHHLDAAQCDAVSLAVSCLTCHAKINATCNLSSWVLSGGILYRHAFWHLFFPAMLPEISGIQTYVAYIGPWKGTSGNAKIPILKTSNFKGVKWKTSTGCPQPKD